MREQMNIMNTMPRTITTASRHGAGRAGERRGNTLVLVAAVLALLVIIATAYVTRTQSQRQVSVAQQSSAMRGENVEVIAETLADRVADALFVWPVDPADPAIWDSDGFPTLAADPNFPRKKPDPNASRYGTDVQWLNGDRVTFPYNRAPYHTVPFTNWPTPQTLAYLYGDQGITVADAVQFLPAGPGNPGFVLGNDGLPSPIPGEGNPALAFESNPMGNPGFGDARWLADIEPVRWTLEDGSEAFSHWRKLTNVATANNSWRVIGDISNVERSIITDLTIPIEQWPAAYRPNRQFQVDQSQTNDEFNWGDTSVRFLGKNNFLGQWANWFGFQYDGLNFPFGDPLNVPIAGYLDAYGRETGNPAQQRMPSNFLRLSNLDAAQNDKHTWQDGGVFQDRPESEFIAGTARHTVSRVLADTTGDGYTDAFWFDPGLPPKDGVRQIVAVRIEDNSSRLNANVATRFQRNDGDFGFDPFTNPDDPMARTRGHTPTDLALVGQLDDNVVVGDSNHWNVGLFDNPWNWRFYFSTGDPTTAPYNVNLWERHLYQTGLPIWNGLGGDPFDQYLTSPNRLDFWQRSARHAQSNQYFSPYQQFSLADDLELRMHHGNNMSWILSDFERTTQTEPHTGTEVLRAAMHTRPEQSEYELQLNNRQLVLDNRRKLTLHSGARNDQLPPWLWWENRYVPGLPLDAITDVCIVLDENPSFEAALPPVVRNLLFNLCPDTDAATAAFHRFLAQSREKLDLREYEEKYYFFENINTRTYHTDNNDNPLNVGRLNLRDRLAPTLMMALTDGPSYLDWDRVYSSYFGDYVVIPEPGEIPDLDLLLTFGNDPADFDDPRYFRNVDGNLNNTRRLAASLAANTLAYRSNDRVRLTDRILLPAHGQVESALGMGGETVAPVFEEGRLEPTMPGGPPPTDNVEIGHIALDYQPFLVEAMIAHLHEGIFIFEGEYMDFEEGYYHCQPKNVTMIMVEIANPFDVPISLEDFRITVFGEPLNLNDLSGPGQLILEPHQSRVFYSIPEVSVEESVTVDVDQWREHFDLDEIGAVDVSDFTEWPKSRQQLEVAVNAILNDFDTGDGSDDAPRNPAAFSRAIEIERFDPDTGVNGVWYVVDRIDVTSPELDALAHDQIVGVSTDELPPTDPGDPPTEGATWYADTNIVKSSCDPNEWPTVGQPISYEVPNALQWVRISRAWQNDPVLDTPDDELNPNDGDHYVSPAERNPRFVFGARQVEVLENTGTMEDVVYQRRIADSDEYYRHWAAIFDQSMLGMDDGDQQEQLDQLPRPRFGFRMKTFEISTDNDPDRPVVFDGNGRFSFPMRMNLKRMPSDHLAFFNSDEYDNPGFEQIGELLNVWLFGHEVEFDTSFAPNQDGWYRRTRTTFTEFMQDAELQGHIDWRDSDPMLPENDPQIVNCWERLRDGELVRNPQYDPDIASPEEREAEAMRLLCIDWLTDSDAHRTNRLRTRPWEMPVQDEDRTRTISAILNKPKTPNDLRVDGLFDITFTTPEVVDELWRRHRADARHGSPALPAGLMVLDAFVADGPGEVWKDQTIPPDEPNQWNDFWATTETLTDEDVQRRRLYNANGFSGKLTPGLININTATPEVMQALPHMARMVHEERSPGTDLWTWHGVPWAIQRYRERLGVPAWDGQPYQQLADERPAYGHRGHNLRPRLSDPNDPALYRYGPVFFGADSDLRIKGFVPGMRGERGMASIGELTLLTQSGNVGTDLFAMPPLHDEDIWRRAYVLSSPEADAENIRESNAPWRIDFAAMRDRTRYIVDVLTNENQIGEQYTGIHPRTYLYPTDDLLGTFHDGQSPPGWRFAGPDGANGFPSSARLSTDVQDRTQRAFNDYFGGTPDPTRWPETVEDAREANLMFSGISNMVTTRSDVFTIYFRVRSFRQNPSTGVWDATDPEHIVDDARYVMLVDRSEVNRPSDKPRILYFERLTN